MNDSAGSVRVASFCSALPTLQLVLATTVMATASHSAIEQPARFKLAAKREASWLSGRSTSACCTHCSYRSRVSESIDSITVFLTAQCRDLSGMQSTVGAFAPFYAFAHVRSFG